MATYRALDWVLLEPATDRVNAGDLVSMEAGGMPVFEVESVEEGVVALRDERRSTLRLCSLDNFRWRGAPH